MLRHCGSILRSSAFGVYGLENGVAKMLHHFLYEVEEFIRHIAEGHIHEGWGRDN